MFARVSPRPYLNHGPVADEVRPEFCHILREVADVADECSLEADLRLAQLVRSTLGLKSTIPLLVLPFFPGMHGCVPKVSSLDEWRLFVDVANMRKVSCVGMNALGTPRLVDVRVRER